MCAPLQSRYGPNQDYIILLSEFKKPSTDVRGENGMHTIILYMYVPYSRKRGPMGGAPYNGPRLGDGPIFEVTEYHIKFYSKSLA